MTGYGLEKQWLFDREAFPLLEMMYDFLIRKVSNVILEVPSRLLL